MADQRPARRLIILEPDFERLYVERDASSSTRPGSASSPIRGCSSRATRSRRRSSSGCSTGRPGRSRRGCATRWPASQLRNAVTITDQAAVVDLTGLPVDPAPVLSEICAQIVLDARAAEPDRGDPRGRPAGGHRRHPAAADRRGLGRLRPRRRAAGRGRPLPERRRPAHGDHGRAGAGTGRHRRLRAVQRRGVGRTAHRQAVVPRRGARRRRPARRCSPGPTTRTSRRC